MMEETYRIGMILAASSVRTGIVDENCRIVAEEETAAGFSADWREGVSLMARSVTAVMKRAGISPERCGFLGIGSPGVCNGQTGEVVYSHRFSWNHAPVVKELRRQLSIPCALSNDVSCMALGEVLAGAALHCSNAVLLTIGQEIGSGVIAGGRISGGKYCTDTGLGHCTLVYGGKVCYCGRKGCLERYASVPALLEQAAEAAAKSRNSLLSGQWPTGLGPAQILECAARKDRTAKRVLDRYIDYICEGIVNAVNIFRPEAVILGGEAEWLWKDFIEEINSRCCGAYYGRTVLPAPRILPAALGNEAGMIGAAFINERE